MESFCWGCLHAGVLVYSVNVYKGVPGSDDGIKSSLDEGGEMCWGEGTLWESFWVTEALQSLGRNPVAGPAWVLPKKGKRKALKTHIHTPRQWAPKVLIRMSGSFIFSVFQKEWLMNFEGVVSFFFIFITLIYDWVSFSPVIKNAVQILAVCLL